MKLSELIASCGDETVEFQNLDQAAISLSYSHKKGTTITFGTTMDIRSHGTKKIGLVVWLDRDAVAKAIKK